MAVARIGYSFYFDTGTITSSTEETGYDDDNVVDDRLSKKWRSTGDTSQWIKFDLGAGKSIGLVAVFGHNLSATASVVLEGNNTDVWTSPSYQESFDYNSENLILWPGADVGACKILRWWRITIDDPSNPDAYVEIGRICGGNRLTPTQNFQLGAELIPVDPSERFESEGQDAYFQTKDIYWVYRIPWEMLEKTDKDNFRTMWLANGKTEPYVVTLDPTNEPHISTIYAYAIENPSIVYRAAVPMWDMFWGFQEII